MSLVKILMLSLLAVLIACDDNPDTNFDEADLAQVVVDSAIAAVGGDILDNGKVNFKFRVRDYIYQNRYGRFEYTRILKDSTGITVDVLNNDGLIRTHNAETLELDSIWQSKYSNSINSVMYFAFLPYRLNDEAVIKTYQGKVEINGREYHQILVQFEEEGGGKDHDDNFLYWFDSETYTMDFFAYDYITDGGGVRFREGYNRLNVNGLVVQDYINYKPVSDSVKLKDMLDAFENGELVELSRIELEEVGVLSEF